MREWGERERERGDREKKRMGEREVHTIKITLGHKYTKLNISYKYHDYPFAKVTPEHASQSYLYNISISHQDKKYMDITMEPN